MWKLKKYHNNNKGFTFIELMITMGIIAVLSGIGAVAFSKISATNQQTQCVNNLREISQGLQLYHNDFRTFPDDGYPDDANDLYPLSTDLAVYLPVKSTFVCPEDEDATSISDFTSYDPYYVARPASYQNGELVIGCPRHRDASSSTSLFSMGSTEITDIDIVKTNGLEIPADGTKADRTISTVNDVMEFADGSTVTLNAAGDDYGCFLIQSVRLADGTLYSIVRVQDDGTIDVSVNSGSKFEIVTPSAVVGVRGTKFDVVTTNGGNTTNVNLTEGTVILMDSVTGETTTLTEGGITTASVAINTHEHPHWHADATYHEHYHPNLNLAHHGNPALAMKVASAAGGGEEDPEDPEISPEDQALIDIINDTVNYTASDVSSILHDASPLSDAVLLAMINRDPMLPSNTNEGILTKNKNGIKNIPLSETVLIAALNKTGLIDNYLFTLQKSSPLTDNVLDIAINSSNTGMDSRDYETLLTAHVPLSDTVWLSMLAVDGIMLSSDYRSVFDEHPREDVSDDVLNAAINKGDIMLSAAWKFALINKSPLSEPVLDTLVNSSTTMSSLYYRNVFLENSPGLPQSILDQLAVTVAIMDDDDRQDVLDANP